MPTDSQVSETSFEAPTTMSDADELKRYVQMHGLGQVVYEDPRSDDELRETLSELGVNE